MALHSFDPEVAEIVGVNAATIYQNIVYWIEKNQANDKHLYDGQYWTYNSTKAFGEQFPYLTSSQIKTAINKLIEQGFIVKGDYNKANFDKTCWYGLAIDRQSISEKSPMEWSEIANGVAKNRQPIPDSKPNIKPDTSAKRTVEQRYGDADDPHFAQFLEKVWPHSWRSADSRKSAFKAFYKLTDKNRERLINALPAAVQHFKQRENQFRPMMASWINDNGWEQFQPAQPEKQDDSEWVKRIEMFNEDGFWAVAWGPKPGEHGCKAPSHLTAPKGEAA